MNGKNWNIMMTARNLIVYFLLTTGCLLIFRCKEAPYIDKVKRDLLIEKYDLLDYANSEQPVFMSIDEFFDGNNDWASIAPNLISKPAPKEYYATLKNFSSKYKDIDILVEIKDVIIYEDGQPGKDEWFYTDIIYFIGNITKEQVLEETKHLLPDEVGYDTENKSLQQNEKYRNKNIVYIWWD